MLSYCRPVDETGKQAGQEHKRAMKKKVFHSTSL
jgi:hypothetical protein